MFFPDSEAMVLSLQITISCPRALSRQVAGSGRRRRCSELAVHVVETGCWVPGAGSGAGAGCAHGGERLLALPGAGAGAGRRVLVL